MVAITIVAIKTYNPLQTFYFLYNYIINKFNRNLINKGDVWEQTEIAPDFEQIL